MQRSIATISISGPLTEKLEAISVAGFDGIEMFENDLLYFDGTPRDVRRIAEDRGLEILLFQPFRDFEGCPRDRLQANLDRAERKFELMGELGAQRMLVCSNVAPQALGDLTLLADDLRQLAERAARHGITIGYEALNWGSHIRTSRQAWQLVQAVDHPRFGLVLDSFHLLAGGESLNLLDDIPGERIVYVQLSDAPRLSMDTQEWSRHFRCFPGQGQLPLTDFTRRVVQTGYQGPWSLEIFNDGFRSAPASVTAHDGYRSLLLLEEETRTSLQDAALLAGSAADQARQALTTATPLPVYGGVEFLEFAVDADHAQRLAAWFAQLGFEQAGEHRSKKVSLYRNQGVNLILNEEPNSFAHAYFSAHGPSLCAVAYRVSEAQPLLSRARDFQYTSYEGRVGPNENKIPALRAPDGSLIYLVEDAQGQGFYDADFRMQAPPGRGPLITAIDHYAIALPPGTLDHWVTFFRALLGFEADHEFVLPDPYGVVHSRAVRSPCGRIRVPLNISESRDTAISRAVMTYHGSGLQHLAFSTSDIIAAVRSARANGLPLLDVPRNYYDDLAARHDLPQETIDQLAELNILYDRDAQGGELFHAYTTPFEGGRFFFELLERRGGYNQYGAANVGIRTAIQAAGDTRALPL